MRGKRQLTPRLLVRVKELSRKIIRSKCRDKLTGMNSAKELPFMMRCLPEIQNET